MSRLVKWVNGVPNCPNCSTPMLRLVAIVLRTADGREFAKPEVWEDPTHVCPVADCGDTICANIE